MHIRIRPLEPGRFLTMLLVTPTRRAEHSLFSITQVAIATSPWAITPAHFSPPAISISTLATQALLVSRAPFVSVTTSRQEPSLQAFVELRRGTRTPYQC